MEPILSKRFTVVIVPALASLIVFCSGCHQRVAEHTQTSLRTEYPRAVKPSTFSFGAIKFTFADVYAEPDPTSERLTQCMYGDVIRIEKEMEWWYAVKVGPYPELPGWIPKPFVAPLHADALYLKERSTMTIVIRQRQSEVFIWPSQTLSIAMGTELPFLGQSGQWYLVRLPTNDVGRISRDSVHPISQIEKPLIASKQEPILIPQTTLAQRQSIITTAQKFLGKVYIWGGTTPSGFDCSGLTYFVYKLNGIELPRVSWLQYRNKSSKMVKKPQLVRGDLVFFETYKPGPSHVGIYIGNNQFIHASPKYGVTISDLDEPYFKNRYVGAKTVFLRS